MWHIILSPLNVNKGMCTWWFLQAVDELFRMMKLMTQKPEGCSEEEAKAIAMFRRTTLQMYLASLDARSSWQTLIM